MNGSNTLVDVSYSTNGKLDFCIKPFAFDRYVHIPNPLSIGGEKEKRNKKTNHKFCDGLLWALKVETTELSLWHMTISNNAS